MYRTLQVKPYIRANVPQICLHDNKSFFANSKNLGDEQDECWHISFLWGGGGLWPTTGAGPVAGEIYLRSQTVLVVFLDFQTCDSLYYCINIPTTQIYLHKYRRFCLANFHILKCMYFLIREMYNNQKHRFVIFLQFMFC